MKRTPIYDAHVALNAKLVDFAGWEMPIQYSGVVDEYQAVRTAAGLFDVSHMGRIAVTGQGSLAFLNRVTTNDVAKIAVKQSQYSMVCNPEGGIKDDVFIYHVKPYHFLVCVNASNQEKILTWLNEQVAHYQACTVHDRSGELAQVALQGPASRSILESLHVPDLAALKPRHCLEVELLGTACLIARTGYTGEPGYELYIPCEQALFLWNELLRCGRAAGLKPAGLGSRDLLRLEMGYLLYGNDIMEETTPLEAGAAWVVDLQKCDFIGRERLKQQHDRGVARRLVAFELLQKAVPRHGFKIFSNSQSAEKEIGEVTSGNLSPILQKGIGLGYVLPESAAVGCHLTIDIRGKMVPAVVVNPPFYKRKGV
ncbi:MAG: glycine cleavage system aminomethyltransferase GcvT [Nitrospiraceae bacterium]